MITREFREWAKSNGLDLVYEKMCRRCHRLVPFACKLLDDVKYDITYGKDDKILSYLNKEQKTLFLEHLCPQCAKELKEMGYIK